MNDMTADLARLSGLAARINAAHKAATGGVDTKSAPCRAFGNDDAAGNQTKDDDGVDTKGHDDVTFGNDGSVDTKHRDGATFGNDDTIGFIRVRKRKLKGGHRDWREYLEAIGKPIRNASVSFDLVRAVRVNGKPRHQFVIGFGSQKNIADYRWSDMHFWEIAVYRMHKHGLAEAQCQRLVAEMVRKGARLPTMDDCEKQLQNDDLVAFMAILSTLEVVDTKLPTVGHLVTTAA